MPLQVGIIGAGIGGLSAAIGLRRAGAEVEVFERSAFKDEVGAAITITPNGSRILDSWEMDNDNADGVYAANIRLVHAHSLETAAVEELGSLHEEFGAKMVFYHRADLHRVLRRMAQSDDGRQPGLPVQMRLGHEVVGVDCDSGIIRLANGMEILKDVVVIADGIRSAFVSQITGQDEPILDTGWSSYRCLVPMDKIMKDPATRRVFENQKPGYWIPFDLRKAFYMVAYPCCANKTLNIAIRHNTQLKDREKEGWNSPANVADVLRLLHEYNPLLGRLVEKASDIKIYKYLRREPLETYNRGRAVLLGDAAHTILPTNAQGAVLAIEEAAALELLFSGISDPSQVSSRLQLYTKTLKKHMHINQHLADTVPGTYDWHRQKAEKVWVHSVPPASLVQITTMARPLYPYNSYSFSLPVRKFFYGYDVRAQIAMAIVEERRGAAAAATSVVGKDDEKSRGNISAAHLSLELHLKG